MNRRELLLAGAAALVARVSDADATGVAVTSLRAPEPMAQVRTDGAGGLLAVSRSGVLWQCKAANADWRRVAADLDPDSPVARAHGRIAARHAGGGLWVSEGGRGTLSAAIRLAPAAGLLILPLGIVGIVEVAGRAHVSRFEPGQDGRWAESARGAEPVLPDARPVQVDLDGGGPDGEGHVAVLAGPDHLRYAHGVLGDAIESTRVLYVERHGLQTLRVLAIPAPFVVEDLAPRPVAWRDRRGLLTMRSGPEGAQLAIVAASAGRSDALEFVALGAPIGLPNRWMAATTDGRRLLAVHTPHLGGVLHEYRAEGTALRSRVVAEGVCTHRLGSRELDLSVWTAGVLVLPAQDRMSLRCLDAEDGFMLRAAVPLPGRVVATAAMRSAGGPGAAVLLDDGQVLVAAVRARR